MIKAVIIDDEASGREFLSGCLSTIDTVQCLGEADGVESGIELINNVNPDLVFLDIEMGDGTGFDLLDKIGRTDFHVIFATSHTSFTLKAIKYSALDYLLKPIDPEELKEAIDKVELQDDQSMLIENLIKSLKSNSDTKRIALLTHGKYEFIEPENIICIKSDNRYTEVTTTDKEMFVSKSIKEFEEILNPTQFIRIHREYMINIEFVKFYSRDDGGVVTLVNDKAIPVARRKKAMVEEILLS